MKFYTAGTYDVIVIGGGHAGCEACLAAARMGCRTLLLTLNITDIALMPCNPSIGGPAKAQLVREIDALGGEMGKNIDKTNIQMRMINTGKGPAVQSLRAQADKQEYQKEMRNTLFSQKNLDVVMAEAESVLMESNTVKGVTTKTGATFYCTSLVLTTGTFLKGRIIIGDVAYPGGPGNQFPAMHLSDSLVDLGLTIGRFKTGTPPRIDRKTVDFTKMDEQKGDAKPLNFSFITPPNTKQQLSCWLTHSNPETHRIVMENIDRAPLFTGLIKGKGPRYCPSFEDKVVRFAHKSEHQLFVEPEGRETDEMYVQGLNTSMPEDVQIQVLHSIPGLENCRMVRTGYAIEYDYVLPYQLKRSLETRKISGLFTGGQINGTSGYEEAAAQGLIAGINAAQKALGREPFILKRSEAYIGVLVDDLVSKNLDEPYRLLTSRAEYRLLLRQDNADLRLTEKGRAIGLVDDERWAIYQAKKALLEEKTEELKTLYAVPSNPVTSEILEKKGSSALHERVSLWNLLQRPEITVQDYLDAGLFVCENEQVIEQVEIQSKYEGYIQKQEDQVRHFEKMESKLLPADLDYDEISGLANEARARLKEVRPDSIGQAGRLAGVNPADIQVLLIELEKRRRTRA